MIYFKGRSTFKSLNSVYKVRDGDIITTHYYAKTNAPVCGEQILSEWENEET